NERTGISYEFEPTGVGVLHPNALVRDAPVQALVVGQAADVVVDRGNPLDSTAPPPRLASVVLARRESNRHSRLCRNPPSSRSSFHSGLILDSWCARAIRTPALCISLWHRRRDWTASLHCGHFWLLAIARRGDAAREWNVRACRGHDYRCTRESRSSRSPAATDRARAQIRSPA